MSDFGIGSSAGELTAQALGGSLGDRMREVAMGDDMKRAADEGRIEEAESKFEALLATQLVKELRRGLGEGFFGTGPGADTFEGWFDEHLGNSLAESGVLELRGILKVRGEVVSAADDMKAIRAGQEGSE